MKTFKLSRIILISVLTVFMGAANASSSYQNPKFSQDILQKDSSQTINNNYKLLSDEDGVKAEAEPDPAEVLIMGIM